MQALAGTQRLHVTAPAKINFGLRVVGRRPDGYHELESVFLPLDLADDLRLDVARRAAATVALSVEHDPEGSVGTVRADDSNLALRAARAFLERSGLAAAVRIELTKRIPVAAGLGGGSSDAAAVLRALTEAFPGALAREALGALAVQLGADVPFFLDPRPALVTGIGEHLEPLPHWPPLSLLLANPGIPLSTAEVFRATDALRPELTSPGPAPRMRTLAEIVRAVPLDPLGDLAPLLENDLEPAAARLCPPVARLRERLHNVGALAIGMSGSGPTVFGVFEGIAEARSALERAAFEVPIWARVAVAGNDR